MEHQEKKSDTSLRTKMMQLLLLALALLVPESTSSDYTTSSFALPASLESESCKVSEEDYVPAIIRILPPCLISQTTYPGNQKRTIHWNTSLNV